MMDAERKEKLKVYAVAIALPLAVGGLSALLTGGGMQAYGGMNKPAASPPGWLFPVVWSVLYVLMGVSSGMVYLSESDAKKEALAIYGLQLFLNFGWSILFFAFQWYLAAFVWLIVLEGVIIIMIATFSAVRPLAGLLQIPYALWVAFAAYLNLGAYLLN